MEEETREINGSDTFNLCTPKTFNPGQTHAAYQVIKINFLFLNKGGEEWGGREVLQREWERGSADACPH